MKNSTCNILLIAGITLIKIPQKLDSQLSSRGPVMVNITLDKITILAPLEPDGNKGHWLEIEKSILKKLNKKVGESITISLEQTNQWNERVLPEDFESELKNSPIAEAVWQQCTPSGQWEYIRWVNATNNQETRAKRIMVAISKLSKKMKRPCCFDTAQCTVMKVSKGGKLIV